MSNPRRYWRKIRWASAAAVIAVAAVLTGTVFANAESPSLVRRTPAQLLALMRGAKPPTSMQAVVSETANLGFPSLPNIPGLSSSSLSATSLITGTHTVDLWYAAPNRLRVAMPVSFGETDLRIDGRRVWQWNSRTQTATRYLLPARLPARPGALPEPPRSALPAKPALAGLTPLQAARRVLALAGPTTKVTVTGLTTVAGRIAYQLSIVPRGRGSLIGQVLIAVDAQTYLPLQVQVIARGQSVPAFEIGFTSLSLSRPASSNFAFTPPPGSHVKTIRLGGKLPVPPSGRTPSGRTPSGRTPSGRTPSGPKVLGKGWLSVAAVPAGQAFTALPGSVLPGSVLPGSVLPGSGGSGSSAHKSSLTISGPGAKAAGQAAALAQSLLKAATKVSGSWGSGRLLRTSLFSVLITNKGTVLIGAVTPRVLYADAAQVP
ncbi:MAG: LolA family protein [Streptosporangiaceae bacterium]